MSESTRMMLGLVIGIAIMIVLVMKTKVHTFIALLLAALITGLIGGMPVADITNAAGETTVGVMTAIKDGFGNTLKSTGIIIGDRKSTRLNSSHNNQSRMPSSA